MHTIVWIHGFPLSSAIFEPQRRIDGYRHVMPDLPGFGATPSVDATSMASYAQHVLDAIDVDRFVLAGFSMGGYIAMELVRQVPERIETLLLLDTREVPDTDKGRANRLRQADDVAKNGIGGVVEAMLPKMVAQDGFRDAVRRIMESSSPQGVIAALKAMAARPDSTETLRNATMPAFVVCGDRDEITPMRDAERMVSLLPHAELAPIARAAHMANYEASEQVNNLIAAFLGRALR
ncbi:MAG TPA: alpha/beta hydrolase [Thermoanaerobaculia bacterium]|nr:alpha/beta hydrolase [Thermoanaerobaculia bacterium]